MTSRFPLRWENPSPGRDTRQAAVAVSRWPLTLQVMGVLNVTPDSFSDGGEHADPKAAIAAGLAMAAAGASIVDVGGESTRPGAEPLAPEVERDRVIPVISGLAREGVTVSADTRNATTMAAALDAGASIINDVSGLTYDPAAASLLARSTALVVLMHMRGTPATMQAHAHYEDVARDVTRELAERLTRAEEAGILQERIALDPGIGFAKTTAHNLELLSRLPLLLALGCPLVVGVSRKRFIGEITGAAIPRQRVAGSLAAALFAASRRASVLRVHDVPETIAALRVWQALASQAPPERDEEDSTRRA